MMTLKESVLQAASDKKAIGHFNISDLTALKAIWRAARDLNVPVVIGTSEGERDFIGPRKSVMLVKYLRERFNFPIFINADHTHSLEKIKEAAEAGYDSIIADFASLPLEENIAKTKEAVEIVRSIDPNILIEGELGYIGTSSEVFKEIPAGAAIDQDDLTTPEDAARFVGETGVDMLAPAVGNIHGMFASAPSPRLNIERILSIKEAVPVPLVLHGGSGILDEDFKEAIRAGISIVHINTEIRRAWREGVERGLRENSETVAPYKIMGSALEGIYEVVKKRLDLFSR